MSSIAHRGFVHLGMDVSKDTIAVTVLLPDRDTAEADKIFRDTDSVRRLVKRLGKPKEIWACYEADPPVMTSSACSPRWGCAAMWWPLLDPQGLGRSGQDRPSGRPTTGEVAPSR